MDGTLRSNSSPTVFEPWCSFVLILPQYLTLMLSQVVYNGKELNHPFGISHYRNFIFWTEYMNASVFQLDLFTGDVTPLRSERPPLFGLRVYDAQSQQGWPISFFSLSLFCPSALELPALAKVGVFRLERLPECCACLSSGTLQPLNPPI